MSNQFAQLATIKGLPEGKSGSCEPPVSEEQVNLFLELFSETISDGKNTVPVIARQPNNA